MTLEEIDTRYHEAALDEEAEAWPDDPNRQPDRRTGGSGADDESAGQPPTGGTGAA